MHQSTSTESRVVIRSDHHIRSGHRHPHQSASTESPSVIHFDNRRPFRPPSSASISTNRVARRHPLRQPSFVQTIVTRIKQRQLSCAPSSAPITIIRSSHRRPHQSAPTDSRVVLHSDCYCSFSPPPSASINAIRFARRHLFQQPSFVQASSPASISVNRFARRQLFRPTSFASINAIAPTASMRFKQHHPLHPPPFAPAARCAARTLFSHGRRRGDCLGKDRLRRGRQRRCSFFAGFCAFFAKMRRKSRF